jgi:hypothetical protein
MTRGGGAALAVAILIAATAAHGAAVIKGGTLIITPGASVEGNIAHIRTIKEPAGLEVDCPGGATYAVSTGTRHGTCNIKTDDAGAVESAHCDDDSGNRAAMSCGADGGKGACGEAAGTGSCQPK